MIEIVGDNMKVTLTNGLEIECTPEEYEILCNKGLIPGVGSDKKTTITINENDPWDVINNTIRYLHTSPTAGTEADSITPEQFMKLKSIVGDNSSDKPGDNTVRE